MRFLFIVPKQEVPRPMYTEKVWRQYTRSAQVLPNMPSAYLAAWLEKAGFEVKIIDAFAERLTVEETARRAKEFDPVAVGYNLITENFLDTLAGIRGVKEFTGMPVIAGGLHMSLYPAETMTHEAIDYGVTGEGWQTLPELIRIVADGGDPSSVRGVCYRREGEYLVTEPRPDTLTLEDVPFPARHLLPNDRYTTVMSRQWPITVMVSALGCPFQCAYCDVPTDRYQARAAEHVVDEMEECVNRYGIKEIWFQDESFTIDDERVTEICETLLSRGVKVAWSIRTRPDLVKPGTLRLMKRAGLMKVHLGVESGSREVLERLNRPTDLEVVRRAVRWSREEGITTLGFFMIGLPGETEEDLRRTIRLALELGCDYIQVNKFVPCPPSPLYRELVKSSGIDYWAEYTRGDAGIIGGLAGKGSTFTPDELDNWQRRFFRKYYYRPSYIWKRLREISSFKELRNLAEGALSVR